METVHYVVKYTESGGNTFRETSLSDEFYEPDKDRISKSVTFHDKITFEDKVEYDVCMGCYHVTNNDLRKCVIVHLELPAVKHNSRFFEIICNYLYFKKIIDGHYEDIDPEEKKCFYEENKEDFTDWLIKAVKDLCIDVYVNEIEVLN